MIRIDGRGDDPAGSKMPSGPGDDMGAAASAAPAAGDAQSLRMLKRYLRAAWTSPGRAMSLDAALRDCNPDCCTLSSDEDGRPRRAGGQR
jgi:hypothetical protein